MKNADRFLVQLLIPINLNKLKREDELHIHDAYRPYLQTRQEFTHEVHRWKARLELYSTDQVRPSHICETLELVNKKLYPQIYLTMPPSTATIERPFSLLKHLKRHIYVPQFYSKDYRPCHCYLFTEIVSSHRMQS